MEQKMKVVKKKLNYSKKKTRKFLQAINNISVFTLGVIVSGDDASKLKTVEINVSAKDGIFVTKDNKLVLVATGSDSTKVDEITLQNDDNVVKDEVVPKKKKKLKKE